MKKILINMILIICAIIAVVSVCAVAVWKNKEKSPDELLQQNVVEMSELLLEAKEKACEKENALWLIENYDTPFDVTSSGFISVINESQGYFFDTYYLRSGAFYKEKNSTYDYALKTQKITSVINYIKNKGKKCALVFDSSFISSEFTELFLLCDRIVISGLDKKNTQEINEITSSLKNIFSEKNTACEIQLMLSNDFAQYKDLNFENINSIYLSCSNDDETGKLNQWQILLQDTACTVTASFYFTNENNPSDVLKLVYDTNSMEFITSRCFSSYLSVSENKDNAFGAVSDYITDGIVYDLAFRDMSVVGYEGEVIESETSEIEVTFIGSNLFPFECNGERYFTENTGIKTITLQLDEGENTFRFTQDGKTFLFKATYEFDGDLIESVFPKDEISVSPGEEIEVMVVAYSKCEVTIKLGAQRFQAKAQEKQRPCYTAFTAKITMPSSFEELSSVGSITVIATHNGESVQQKAAAVKAYEAITDFTTTKSQQSTSSIENYVPSIPDTSVTYSQSVATTSAFIPVTVVSTEKSENNSQETMVGIIITAYADTWSNKDNDDTYSPLYTALCQGTMDYIVGETSAYNSDDEKEVYFYQLSSGRKVRKENVQVINCEKFADNTMSVSGVQGENGEIQIKIKTDWKVPYAIDYSPQNYFTAYGKQFNVSSFTADKLTYKFYYTTAVNGEIDTSLSDVLSGADFSVSKSSKTATLTLKLKTQGEYYGSSVSYDNSGNMVITVNNKPKKLSGTVIMLDPGHGGKEPGAVGIGSAVLEKNVNLAIAHQAKTALEQMGATVIMTRYGDETLTLEQRKVIMRQYKPDLFVSIHSNGSYNTETKGTSTYYFKPFSKNLADNIFEQLVSVYRTSVYAGRVELYDEIAEGTKYYPFSVTRVEECPSVLIEVGYMTNDEECYQLINSENQKQFGEAIAKGIEQTILG